MSPQQSGHAVTRPSPIRQPQQPLDQTIITTSTIHNPKSHRQPPATEPSTTASCGCPQRRKPPLKPTTLPYPATEQNREKLQRCLLNHYQSSTFDTCEHKPLPLMDTIP